MAILVVLPAACAHRGSAISEGALASRVLAPPDSDNRMHVSVDANLPQPGFVAPLTVEPTPAALSAGQKPLSLEDAVALAFQSQPRLRLFRERIEEARGRGQSAFAPFLPQLMFIPRAFAGQNPNGPVGAFALPLPEVSDAPGYQTFAVAELMLQWTVWDFGRTYGRYQQAELSVDIARLQAARADQAVAFEVAISYFAVLQARAETRVAVESVRRAESILGITRKMREAGSVESDQVLRADVQLAQARKAVVRASRDEQVAIAALNRTIGLNVSNCTDIDDRTDVPEFSTPLVDCLREAVANRREFQVARKAIEVAQEGVRVVRADFAPKVYVQGVALTQTGHQTLEGGTETGSIILAWQLFDGGRRLGDIRTAGASVQAAAAQAQIVCDNIAYEVNEAFRDIEAARQDIDLSRPQVAQARENLRLVSRKYEAGDATPTDVVDAETSLTRAQQDFFRALYGYHAALARIKYATGIGPGSEVNESR